MKAESLLCWVLTPLSYCGWTQWYTYILWELPSWRLPCLTGWPERHSHHPCASPIWLRFPRNRTQSSPDKRRKETVVPIAQNNWGNTWKEEVLETPARNGKQICSTASWEVWALGASCLIYKILSRNWKSVQWNKLPGSWQEQSMQQQPHSGRNVGNCLEIILKVEKCTLTFELTSWVVCIQTSPVVYKESYICEPCWWKELPAILKSSTQCALIGTIEIHKHGFLWTTDRRLIIDLIKSTHLQIIFNFQNLPL